MKSCSQWTSSASQWNIDSEFKGRKFKVPSCKFKVKNLPLNFELATWNLQLELLDWREDRWRVVGDAEGDAGARAELREALYARGVEAQAGRLDLKTEAELAERFGAERAAPPRVLARPLTSAAMLTCLLTRKMPAAP
jgi:hypothetical protein